MNHISIIDILNSEDYFSKEVNICGWVKTFRANRFIALNDGSSIKNIQCVIDFENTDPDKLKKISNSVFDNYGFTKSRSIKQLVFYLKYFILIREWFKEAQIEAPDLLNETIFHLGQGYAFTWQNIKSDILMNGNNISNNNEFDHYLKRFGYKFKNENKEFGGYSI